jgi:ubiquinone/menaquinone biosynthesis C-methylase UbiE
MKVEVAMEELARLVANHYGRQGLLQSILAGLKAAGADVDNLEPTDLAPVDEFHTAGRVTTLKALRMMPLEAGMHVLDAGCGLGGTARALAKEYGCRVTGIDLTPEYIEVADALTERMGLEKYCTFQVGNVIETPFADAAFDAALSFHAAMNISERDRFYAELARVLRPEASLCLFDVMRGPVTGMLYPMPWAETEKTSFLKTPAETKELLRDNGFHVTEEESQRDVAIQFLRESLAKVRASGPAPLGLHLLTGGNTFEKFSNFLKAWENGFVEPVILIARRKR